MRLIRRLEPDVTIWYHQPLALVDVSGGDAWVERRYARLVGLPLERLPRYHGTATSWQNHEVGGTAFVVELPSGPLRPREARRHARAVRRLAVLLAGAGDAPSERDRASVRPPERGDRTP
jgi:protein MpaA